MEDKRQMEGLFRYSLIRELSDPELRPRRRGEMVHALTELGHVRTDGERVRVSGHVVALAAGLAPGLRLHPGATTTGRSSKIAGYRMPTNAHE
jgi:hypothetical protein